MGRSVKHDLPVRQSRGLRRSMLMLLAFVYLFVGLAHSMTCLDEAIASSVAIEKSPATSDDGMPKPGLAQCDHCPSCTPAITPASIITMIPAAHPSEPVVTTAELLVAAPLRIDTPPPKHLT